jgi:hypothetical protein
MRAALNAAIRRNKREKEIQLEMKETSFISSPVHSKSNFGSTTICSKQREPVNQVQINVTKVKPSKKY